MENFAIRIDDNVRLRLYKICRLCGDDNPNNTDILTSHKKSTNIDPDFHKKIFECVGIQVTKGDRMPQTACNTCHEKINDFHEFREMCLATDIQTRRLLGLPDTVISKSDPALDVEDDKTEVEKTIRKKNPAATKSSLKNQKAVKAEKKALTDIKKSVKLEREKTIPRFRKKVQIQANPPETVKKKLKAEPDRLVTAKKRKASGDLLTEKPPNKRERHRENIIRKHKIPNIALDAEPTNVFCSICDKGFCNAGELHRHLDTDHVPRIVPFHCVRCDESIEKKTDIRNHTLWHKLSKTPYECGRCGNMILSLGFYTKHLTLCSEFIQEFEYNTKKCQTCNGEFETQNLYNWHKCIINQLKCEVCQQKFSKKSAMVRHIVRCTAVSLSTSLPVVDSALEPEPELDSAPEPEPEHEMNDHFADDDDASDAEMNFKPNLEIDIEVPHKEREPKDKQPSTPFVIIPSSVANTSRTGRQSTSEKLSAPAVSEANDLTTVQNNDMVAGNSLAQSLPMVRIKLEPIGNIVERSCSKNSLANDCRSLNPINNSVSVRVKAEMIDPEYSGLHDSNLNMKVKTEPDAEKEQQQSQSDIRNSESSTPDPLDISYSDVAVDPTKVSSPSLSHHKLDERLPSTIAKPTLKLVIKKQHGTLNSSFVDGSNVLRGDIQPEPKKKKKKKSKIFKIPKELAMRIKQEKLCNDDYDSNLTMNHSIEVNKQATVNSAQSIKPALKSHKKDTRNSKINPMNPAVFSQIPVRIKEEKPDDGYEKSSVVANNGKEVECSGISSIRKLPGNSSNNASNIALNNVRIKQEVVDYGDKPDNSFPMRIKQEPLEDSRLEIPESITPIIIKSEPVDDINLDAVEGLSALPVISEVRSNVADAQDPDDLRCQLFESSGTDIESQYQNEIHNAELTLRIANVSGGNDVLESVKTSAQQMKKSPEKSRKKESKRFPLLRIKSEFSSLNFGDSASVHTESISNNTAITQVKEEPQDIPEESFENDTISDCMNEENTPSDVNTARIKVELEEAAAAPVTSGTRVEVESRGVTISSLDEFSNYNNYACSVTRVKRERDDPDDVEPFGGTANITRNIRMRTESSSTGVIETEEDGTVPIKKEPSDYEMSFTAETEFAGQELAKETGSSTTYINEPPNRIENPVLHISRVESLRESESDPVSTNEDDLLRPIKHEPFYETYDRHPRNVFDVKNSISHFKEQSVSRLRVQSFAALRREQVFASADIDDNALSLPQSITGEEDQFDCGNIVIKSEPSETVFLESRHEVTLLSNCNEVANNDDGDFSSQSACGEDEENIGAKELRTETGLNSCEDGIETNDVSEVLYQETPKNSEMHRLDSKVADSRQLNNAVIHSEDAGSKVCNEKLLSAKSDYQSQFKIRKKDIENAISETENATTIESSFDSVQSKPSVIGEHFKGDASKEIEMNNDISNEVPNNSQTKITPNQNSSNIINSGTKLTCHSDENGMLKSAKTPLSKDDDCATISADDNTSDWASNIVQHSNITTSGNASRSPENQDSISNLEGVESDCNQKLKDLIKDKDHLLGFFEDELSRNCDSGPDERTTTRNTESPEKQSDAGQNTGLISKLPSTGMIGQSLNTSKIPEEYISPIKAHSVTTVHEKEDSSLTACFKREEVDCKASVSVNAIGLQSIDPTTNDNALTTETLLTCRINYDTHANVENFLSKPPLRLQNNSIPTTNALLSPSTSPSRNPLNASIVPSIISLPKAIVSPSVSPSSSSYNTTHLSGLNSSSAGSSVKSPGASIHQENSTMNAPLNLSNEPATQFGYPNADQLESNIYSSTSQMNMLHINEIAENNNNANIERELQNDLDSISSNSNLGFEDAAGPS